MKQQHKDTQGRVKKKINIYRNKIDKIDRKIIKLLKKRLNLVNIIGKIKMENNLPIDNKKRENQILSSIDRLVREKNFSLYIKNIYKNIFDISKTLEKKGK